MSVHGPLLGAGEVGAEEADGFDVVDDEVRVVDDEAVDEPDGDGLVAAVDDEVVLVPVVLVIGSVVVDDVVVVAVRGGFVAQPHFRHHPREPPSASTSVGHFQAAATASWPEPSDEPLAAVMAPSKESAALMTTTPTATIANGARRAR